MTGSRFTDLAIDQERNWYVENEENERQRVESDDGRHSIKLSEERSTTVTRPDDVRRQTRNEAQLQKDGMVNAGKDLRGFHRRDARRMVSMLAHRATASSSGV